MSAYPKVTPGKWPQWVESGHRSDWRAAVAGEMQIVKFRPAQPIMDDQIGITA
jgi:hypothetical protein